MRVSAEPEIRYYRDETKDEFSGIERKTITIDGKYKYLHKNPFWKIAEFLVYRVIMTPVAFLWCKIRYRAKIVGREKLRSCGRFGYFLYGNHTLMDGDAFLPSLATFPKQAKVVVNADNLSVPITKTWIELCGAVPVPTEWSGTRHFLNALEKHTLMGRAVMIYPEAHLWPYCDFIRSFSADSFRYPVRFGMPSYAVTTVCKKSGRKYPNVTVYIDGPFYADSGLPDKEQAKDLRDRIYSAMTEHAKKANYDKYRYIKQETEQKEDKTE